MGVYVVGENDELSTSGFISLVRDAAFNNMDQLYRQTNTRSHSHSIASIYSTISD